MFESLTNSNGTQVPKYLKNVYGTVKGPTRNNIGLGFQIKSNLGSNSTLLFTNVLSNPMLQYDRDEKTRLNMVKVENSFIKEIKCGGATLRYCLNVGNHDSCNLCYGRVVPVKLKALKSMKRNQDTTNTSKF